MIGNVINLCALMVKNVIFLRVPRQTSTPPTEQIVSLLLEDGRRSATDIGRETGLSPAAAKRRIDRLERLEIILGYQAVVDHAKLGNGIEAFAELRFEGATQVDDIDRAFVGLPELVEGFTIAGDTDALVRLTGLRPGSPQAGDRHDPTRRRRHRHEDLDRPRGHARAARTCARSASSDSPTRVMLGRATVSVRCRGGVAPACV